MHIGRWPNDGCHLSDLGYKTVANNVAAVLLTDRKSNSTVVI
jgi:lysophospholipase L1-like esterase